ncbi:dystrophin-like isoform X2 [Chelonus insularis]|uniref:dystrophin-like isoform X2 n=1 Tax=Chelonus insularis TaxID=460826 RepID=UPI001588379C|nr:dystrophin-like isoform X2 [Chelonus insularis]
MTPDYNKQECPTTLESIITAIKKYNGIRYPFYRTAAKVQILHQKLYMQYVSLEFVIGVFERHKLSVTENSVTLDRSEVEDVVFDIYYAAQKNANATFDLNASTELAVNVLLHVFDNKDKVSVFSTKVLLTLLSCGSLHDKYEYLYKLLADHNACLSKSSLHLLLMNICKVTEFLGESVAYGSHLVQSTIDSCFAESQGCLGISKVELRMWLMRDPPLLAWISTFNRLKLAENVVHNIKCSSCKTTPVRGPRFSCMRCVRYHQCQTCFFFAKTSHKHKIKHPVKEYCAETSIKTATKPIVSLFKNKLKLCPIQTTQQIETSLSDTIFYSSDKENTFDTISEINTAVKRKVKSDPHKELSSIINHLEEENKQLQAELKEICGSRAERLQQHRKTVEAQLQRLKILKKCLFHGKRSSFPQTMRCVQSTPLIAPLHQMPSESRFLPLPEFQLSPINHRRNTSQDSIKINGNDSDPPMETRSINHIQRSPVVLPSSPQIELSTWIGGNRTNIDFDEGRFSQWLDPNSENTRQFKQSESRQNIMKYHDDSNLDFSRDNTPSSLQRPDRHSQHSSLQNIQGDLNDILNRLQHMVANECLLEDL